MNWGDYAQGFVALVFVLSLIGVLSVLARHYGLANTTRGSKGNKGRNQKRLHLVTVMPLDNRRKLVLVGRDEREHLILLGPSGDVVIERDISPPDTSDDRREGHHEQVP